MRLSASRCFWPKAPWPATQIFIENLLAANAMDFGARRGALDFGSGLGCSFFARLRLGRRLLRRAGRSLAGIFKNDVADGGVGGRHRIETIDLVHLLIERAAHDE